MIDETRQPATDAPEAAAPPAAGAANEDKGAGDGSSDAAAAVTITLPPTPAPATGEMTVAPRARSLPPPPPSRTGRTTPPPPPVRGASTSNRPSSPRLPLPPPRFASASHPPVSAAVETLASPEQGSTSIAPATVSSPAGVQSTPPAAGDDAARIRQLQALLGQSKQALTNKDNELRAVVAQRDLLRTQVSGREARIRELEKASAREIELRQRTADLERQLGEQQRQIEERDRKLAEQERAVDERDRRLEDRNRERDEHRRQIDERDRKLEERGQKLEERERLIEERDRQLAAVEASRARLAKLEPDAHEAPALRSRVAELEARVAELESEAAALKARIAELAAAGTAASAAGNDTADDLRQIRGIGPAYARNLNAIGVSSYAQIAGWTDDDVIRVAEALKTRPDRIRRDGWVARAKELLEARGR